MGVDGGASLLEEEGISPEDIKVSEIMTSYVVTVRPDENIVSAANKMAEHKIGSVVVVDSAGYVVGILTEADIVRRVVAKGLNPHTTRVEEVMTPNPVTVYEDATLGTVAEYMRSRDIGHIPILDDGNKLVGIVSRTDIISIAPSLIEVFLIKRSSTRLPPTT